MKVNLAQSIVVFGVAALIAFGIHTVAAPNIKTLVTIGAFASCFLTLLSALALSFKAYGAKTNLRVLGLLFFVVLLIEHIVFAFQLPFEKLYIIVTGLTLLVFVSLSAGIVSRLSE
tara:strand:+ start:66 stop:413 length:348 start_codon:yes stop_codon:yes gene_type:complete